MLGEFRYSWLNFSEINQTLTLNIAKLANKKGIKTIQKFFDNQTAQFIKKRFQKAEVITGTNIFAHINKLDSLMKGVKSLINKENGIDTSLIPIIPSRNIFTT